jgi:cytoskeletal protein RodZ
MPSFGPALLRARQQQGISLDDVARDTHLSKRYLLALEDEAIHKLPGGPYNRAYVRTYAEYLGLDPDSLARDYGLEEEAQTKAGLALQPDVLATMRQAAERPRSRPAPRRSGLTTVARVGGLASLAGALIVGLTWVGTRRFTRSDETVPIGANRRPAQVVSKGVAVDQDEAKPPPRPKPGTPPEEVPQSPLDVQARAAGDSRAARLMVTRSGVGTDVVDQQLVGRSDTFAVGTRVAFWTHVTGGRPGETIRHVWSHQGTTAGEVDLPVGSPSWRTQSRRTLVAGAEGDWVVEARDQKGRVLARHEFRCAP